MSDSTKYNVEIRRGGTLRTYLTPHVSGVTWEWSRIGGCGRCTLTLGMGYRDFDFIIGDDVQIRLKSGATSKLVYRGFITNIIPSLKVGQQIKITAKGYFDKLRKLVVQDSGGAKTYTSDKVSDIVDDIADTFITPNSDITKGTIDAASFTADTLDFKTTVEQALRTLAELEGQVEYGVDEDLVFYWRAEESDINHKLLVGDNVELFEKRSDGNQLLNKIYLEGGDVAGSPYARNAENTDSQDRYYLAEGIIVNAAITTQSVADQYLTALLQERSVIKTIFRVKIANTKTRFEDTIPMGRVVVFDAEYYDGEYVWGTAANGGSDLVWGTAGNGGSDKIWGGDYSDQIDRVKYSLSDTDERVNADITLGGGILETSAKIKQLELMMAELRQAR